MNAATITVIQQFCANGTSSNTIGELTTDLADSQVRNLMFGFILHIISMMTFAVSNFDQNTIVGLPFESLGDLGTQFVWEYLYDDFLGHRRSCCGPRTHVLDMYSIFSADGDMSATQYINDFHSYSKDPEATLSKMMADDLDADRQELIADFDRISGMMHLDRHLLQFVNELEPTWSEEDVKLLSKQLVTLIFKIDHESYASQISKKNILAALESSGMYVESLSNRLEKFYRVQDLSASGRGTNRNADFCTLFVDRPPQEDFCTINSHQ